MEREKKVVCGVTRKVDTSRFETNPDQLEIKV